MCESVLEPVRNQGSADTKHVQTLHRREQTGIVCTDAIPKIQEVAAICMKPPKCTLHHCSTVGKNTPSFSTWSKLSGTASRVTAKEGPQYDSVLWQVPLLAIIMGVKTVSGSSSD